MPGPDYINALLERDNHSESPPTEVPWDTLARLLLYAQESDHMAVFE